MDVTDSIFDLGTWRQTHNKKPIFGINIDLSPRSTFDADIFTVCFVCFFFHFVIVAFFVSFVYFGYFSISPSIFAMFTFLCK